MSNFKNEALLQTVPQSKDKPIVIFKIKPIIRRTRNIYKLSFSLCIHEAPFLDKNTMVLKVKNWRPILEYLLLDERYLRGRDYEIVKHDIPTSIGKVITPSVLFLTSECARRVMVFVFSILGVEDRSFWVEKMMRIVRRLSVESVDFWVNIAWDRYILARDNMSKRFNLLQISKAIRILHGGKNE